jgi:hypothetical protein
MASVVPPHFGVEVLRPPSIRRDTLQCGWTVHALRKSVWFGRCSWWRTFSGLFPQLDTKTRVPVVIPGLSPVDRCRRLTRPAVPLRQRVRRRDRSDRSLCGNRERRSSPTRMPPDRLTTARETATRRTLDAGSIGDWCRREAMSIAWRRRANIRGFDRAGTQ